MFVGMGSKSILYYSGWRIPQQVLSTRTRSRKNGKNVHLFIYLFFHQNHINRLVGGTVLNLSDVIGGFTTRGSKGSVEDEHQTQSVEWLHETYEPVS